jgi:3-hydroxybutyryl-CoA dehydrogenase
MNAYEKVAVAGSGTIASGLAACATQVSDVVILARSDASAERSLAQAQKFCGKLEGADEARLRATTDDTEVAGSDLVVEAIVEEPGAKSELLARLAEVAPGADFASTTSSLSIGDLAERSGLGAGFFGLHVFNPVPRMDLVEVCFPADGQDEIRSRAIAWCEAIGKTPVEVPDEAGFVVNRLLFPYLFDAVRLLERTGMAPADVDTCMKLGAAHPLGPLALIDLVGVDVSVAIGQALYADSSDPAHDPPGRLIEMLGEGKLGRKTGEGFFDYS